jgi:hypothetical protein
MRSETEHRSWVSRAIQIIEADFNRSSDTHLLRVPLPGAPGIALYVKDESTHPSGSLKHRLARSLFLYGLCNGWIGPETPIIEASSGSTAVSEAYFAQMLGLRFIAVMPRSTSPEKIAAIRFYGGESHFVDSAAEMYAASARLAASLGGHGATTTLPSPSSASSRTNATPNRPGWWWAPARGARPPRSAGTSATTGMRRSWPWWTRRGRRFTRPGSPATPAW